MSENDNAALLQEIADGRRASAPQPQHRDPVDAERRISLITPGGSDA